MAPPAPPARASGRVTKDKSHFISDDDFRYLVAGVSRAMAKSSENSGEQSLYCMCSIEELILGCLEVFGCRIP